MGEWAEQIGPDLPLGPTLDSVGLYQEILQSSLMILYNPAKETSPNVN